MKTFILVFAAASFAGLAVYAVLDAAGLLGLTLQGRVTMLVGTFVGALTCTGLLGGTVALLLSRRLRNASDRRLDELQQRVERLESERQR